MPLCLPRACSTSLAIRIALHVLRRMNSPFFFNHTPIKTGPALKYIRQHFTKDICESELAELCDLDTAVFNAVFQKENGKSFVDYINSIRISVAKDLLLETRLISCVAHRCGFKDLDTFVKEFKKIENISPLSYRRGKYPNSHETI